MESQENWNIWNGVEGESCRLCRVSKVRRRKWQWQSVRKRQWRVWASSATLKHNIITYTPSHAHKQKHNANTYLTSREDKEVLLRPAICCWSNPAYFIALPGNRSLLCVGQDQLLQEQPSSSLQRIGSQISEKKGWGGLDDLQGQHAGLFTWHIPCSSCN